ncbi:protein S100-A1-like [Hypanus sabinus]|uniref:protein S100-A1-like n=1 Tax=Hypanus sabinus TaxID=79690 RepID=UPI0028C3A208|nr:protein S100-A1-like [Hypanus sabinus]XP_059847308.1 protein S100-A1-like [Hypanus sabinus]
MATPSKIEVAMQNLLDVFYLYAKSDKCTLTKLEMKELVETELKQLTKNKKNVDYFDKLMKELDFDGDGKVNFEEFLSFISGIMFSCNEIYMQKRQQMAKECKK